MRTKETCEIHSSGELTIGMDLGDKASELCAIAEDGSVGWRTNVATEASERTKLFYSFEEPSRVAVQTGTHSLWSPTCWPYLFLG